jgi:hypothetical protein
MKMRQVWGIVLMGVGVILLILLVVQWVAAP